MWKNATGERNGGKDHYFEWECGQCHDDKFKRSHKGRLS